MTFIVGALATGAAALGAAGTAAVIGGVGAIGGAMIGSKGAKDAAGIAASGSNTAAILADKAQKVAREDQTPYRLAGYTALDALMSMSGLGRARGIPKSDGIAPRGGPGASPNYGGLHVGGPRALKMGGMGSAYGRAGGGPLYNVNELGAENIYDGGSVTRSAEPMTLPPSGTGYVGRAAGGPIGWGGPQQFQGGPIGWGGPQQFQGGGKYGQPDFYPGGNNGGPGPKGPAPGPNGGPAPGPNGNGGGPPQENPGGVKGGYQFQTDPGYNFRFDEGVRAMDRSAAASGGLLSGGYGRRLTRYGQDYASNEFSNVYNRIANIAGLGQVSATNSGNASMWGAGAMGAAAQNSANASAYGSMAGTNAWANAANQIGQLPWGKVFNRNTGMDPITGGVAGWPGGNY